MQKVEQIPISSQPFQKNTSTRTSQTIQRKFVQWSQSVTCQCYPKIFKPETKFFGRLIWTLVFASFSGMTSLILVNNIIAYFQYNVVSSIKVVSENPTVFPTVTFCDSNPFTTQQAELVINEAYVALITQNTSGITNIDQIISVESYMTYALLFVNAPEFRDEQRKLLGFNLSELVQSCTFNGISCDFANDFHWTFHSVYGNCFQFNSGLNMRNESVSLKQTTLEGQRFGLVLELGPMMNKNEKSLVIKSQGLKMFIHNASFVPSSFDSALSIESGKETSIAVQRTFSSNLPAPYTDCTDSSNAHKYALYRSIVNSLNKTYQRRDCFLLVYQKALIKACNCQSVCQRPVFTAPFCLDIVQYSCYVEFTQDFSVHSALIFEEYSAECPYECDTVTFDSQVSVLDYPNEVYHSTYVNSTYFNSIESQFGIDMSSLDEYKKHFYLINVFYSSTQYTLITESPQMTLTGLLSNLGGSLGMFLGFSVFTLVEVFEILIEIILICVFQTNK